MRALILALLLAGPALADTAAEPPVCPPAPDTAAERAAILAELKTAKNDLAAQQLMNSLWMIWTRAPDARAQGFLDRGMRRREESDYEGARAEFDALVAYCPHYLEGYNQRAFIEFLQDDFEASLADLGIVLDGMPDHIAALTGRALDLMALGRMDEGQAALREALKMNAFLSERHLLLPARGTDL